MSDGNFQNFDFPRNVRVKGCLIFSIRTNTFLQMNFRDWFWINVPGSSPDSKRTWNPLQIPNTLPPALAKRITEFITGEKLAMAPARR